MRLRFRRHFFSHFVLLAFALLHFEQPFLFGMQELNADGKPNSLRIGAPKGSSNPQGLSGFSLQTPAVESIPKSPAINSPLMPTTVGDSSRDKPITSEAVGGYLLKGNNASQSESEDTLDAAANEQFELALSIATASMSHASPFLWMMSGPTSNLFVDRHLDEDLVGSEVADIAMSDGTQAEVREEMHGDDMLREVPGDDTPPNITSSDRIAASLEAPDLSEPPRLIPAIETGFGNLELQESDPTETENEPKETTKETGKAKSNGRPAPRTVRIPFENRSDATDQEAMRDIAPIKPLNRDRDSRDRDSRDRDSRDRDSRDRDSQREQEEPKLDQRAAGSERDQQGVDALLASKPSNKRREIRIDDPKNEGIQVAPIIQGKPLDAVLAKRLQRAEACLSHYLDNPESTAVRSPWAVMHALLAFGGDYELVHGQSKVNAIGWMCHNGTCRTQRIFAPTGKGFSPNVGDGVQGHEGQFMAILAQSNVPLNYPIQIGSSKFTVEDLVRHEMMTCKEKSELTFKLIGLSYYLESNKQWRANDGKVWSISKLIQEELAQPIVGAACGGVHRLMGFSFSVKQRQLQGQPVNGQFARAAKFVRDYVDYTWQLQNPDGSFSTNWYEGRANDPNDERKVQTTGHMLEWLMYTLPDEELSNPRVGKSIDFLLSKIYDKREQKWPIGPRGHATRAVGLYQARTRETLSKPSQFTPVNSAAKSGATAGAVRK